MLPIIGKLFGHQNGNAQFVNASDQPQEAAARDEQYTQLGFDRAAKHGGEPQAVEKELAALMHNRVFPEYEPSPGKKERLRDEVAHYEAHVQKAADENEALERDIQRRRAKKNNAEEALEELRLEGAYEVSIDPTFWGSLFLLAGLTLLLFLYYPAATYTALFSNFLADLQQVIASGGDVIAAVTQSVFDPAAFRKAWRQGPGTFLLIVLMPVVFFGSGGLLHHVWREYDGWQQKLGAAGLITGVFLLDFVLAYRITSMVYEARLLAGLEEEPWRFWFITTDIHFYLVLICGFIPHLIWAALSFILHEMWIEADPIRRREAQIRRWRAANEADKQRIRENEHRIREWRAIIRQKKQKLEGRIIPTSALEGAVEAFTSGWNGFISASGRRVRPRTSEVSAIAEAFLDDIRAQLAVEELGD